MKYKEYKDIVRCDLYRYGKGITFKSFLKALFIPGFKITFHMRTCDFIRSNKMRYILLFPLFILNYISFDRCRRKYGIFLALNSNISKGLYINHHGALGIPKDSKIGKNFTLFFGSIVAYQGRGKRKGFADVGDNVFLGAGAKIIGKVNIGNNVVIGANSVVTTDLEDNAIVIGNPAKIVSYNGSKGLIYNPCDDLEVKQ